MLHYLDDLDSKMESMRAQFEREADFESAWTGYNPSLARPLLNTRKFLDKKPEKPEAGAAQASPTEERPATEQQAAPVVEMTPPALAEAPTTVSPFEALQKKFDSHKPTPVGAKSE